MDIARQAERDTLLDIIKEMEDLLKVPNNTKELIISDRELDSCMEKVREWDEKKMESMLEDPTAVPTAAEFATERAEIRRLDKLYRSIKYEVEKIMYPAATRPPSSPSESGSSRSSASVMKSMKLPKVEMKKFAGDHKEWLGWWAQFKLIHEDQHTPTAHKFVILFQAMVENSPPWELVKGYPQSDGNYKECVEALQQRYGNSKLLKQLYVRQLIEMISANRKGEKKRLSSLYDQLQCNLRCLETLGVTIDQMVTFLFPMVESSIPPEVHEAWQRCPLYGKDGSQEVPPRSELDYLLTFLKQEIDNEEQRKLVSSGFDSSSKGERKTSKKDKFSELSDVPTAAGLFSGSTSKINKCVFCDKSHSSSDCFSAARMSMEDKKSAIKRKNGCMKCLKIGHQQNCRTPALCGICQGRHPMILCPNLADFTTIKGEIRQKKQMKEVTFAANLNCTSEVILQTLMIRVMNPSTKRWKMARALLDSGSQRTFILESTVKDLHLQPKEAITLNHNLFGGSSVTNQRHNTYEIFLSDLTNSQSVPVVATDHRQICGGLPRAKQGPWMNQLRKMGIILHDLDPRHSDKIEVLIGADVIGKILTGQIRQLGNGLTAMQTELGWCLMGKVQEGESNHAMTVLTMSVVSATVDQLWSLDAIGITDPAHNLTREEKDASTQQHFKETVQRDEEGRYQISLPWNSSGREIPSNYHVALKRLETTTRKLTAERKMSEYGEIFKQWEAEGIISRVDPTEDNPQLKTHYLPHRAVFKPESKTTPVRPVFDASCKIGRSPSLNDCLEKGPNLLELIPSILMRFRMGKIGVISDIRKAFLMIGINPTDRDFLRFMWWDDDERKSIITYRHNRVVFGMNCSPFLLGAVINNHLDSINTENPGLVTTLKNSLYVDNCVLSLDTMEDYHSFQEQSTQALAEAKMELRQWEHTGDSSMEPITNVLGLKWDKNEDTIFCDVIKSVMPLKITKRILLSHVQQVFDPLGFLSPVLIQPKVLLQKSWIQDKKWDEEVTQDVREEFNEWWEQLNPMMESFRLPRNCTSGMKEGEARQELHVFSDASKSAYAAAVFLRTETERGVEVQLIASKSRVTPVKTVTIPRLELLSCTIAARLSVSVKKALDMEHIATYFWNDSTTALAWIRRRDDWGTFVGNRVKEILSLTLEENWNHVPGHMNPADLPSRGCQPNKFLALRWWEGPDWLKKDRSYWPSHEPAADENEVKREMKTTGHVIVNLYNDDNPWYMRKDFPYEKNLRIMTNVFRFIQKLRKSPNPRWEIEDTEQRMFQLVQEEVFDRKETVFETIRATRDSNGTFRVKTKLIFRKDSIGFKYPVLLPHSHPYVDLYVMTLHKDNCHGGIQFLMGATREKVWILRPRKAIGRIVASCHECRRHNAKRTKAAPIALPPDRVDDATAFRVTGVDLAGPLTLLDCTKVYIVLFTCSVYRCVHLELVQSLTSVDFVLAFIRFMRRNTTRPAIMYSDNGTNFVGANNLFSTIDWEDVQRKTNHLRIRWKFNPPGAPWWGGWWERLIRSVKDLLRRMLGLRKLTMVELETCLCEVQVVINNRPLTCVTEDQDDLIPLTPSMFMRHLPACENIPEASAIQSTVDALHKRKRGMGQLLEELRERFRKEYLGHLVQRGKEQRIDRKLEVGEIVLVEKGDVKRVLWPMARILELVPGKDGVPRMAKLRTMTGIIFRPIQRLFPMELPRSGIPPPTLPPTEIDLEGVPETEEEIQRIESSPEEEVQVHPIAATTRSGRTVKQPNRLNM